MPSKNEVLAFLALPFIGFAGLIAFSVMNTMGPHFTLPVQGYDPRDVLYGHFLRLQIKPSVVDDLKECACINNESIVEYTSCEQAAHQSCVAVINKSNLTLLDSMREHFQIYVDESRATMLEEIARKEPQRLSVDVGIINNRISVRGLMLDGKPAKDAALFSK